MEMIDRFRGHDGYKRLISALHTQAILHNNEPLINEIADQAELLQFESEDTLITQSGVDNDIYFIFSRTTFYRCQWTVASNQKFRTILRRNNQR